jgi:hypothetical protein
VTEEPAVAALSPSDFVIDTSARGASVSVSVAESSDGSVSFVPTGGVTVAVFANVPVAVDEIAPTTVYATLAPTGIVTASLMEPEPLEVHEAPDEATHVHVALVSALGIVSVTLAPITFDGPALFTTMV